MNNLTQKPDLSQNENSLKDLPLAFIGCGVMAESIVAGALRASLVQPDQIFASHPRAARRHDLAEKYGITVLADNAKAVRAVKNVAEDRDSMIVLCVKPQRLTPVLSEIQSVVGGSQLVVSIVAGARIATLAETLNHPAIVRTMPNTPSQVGAGMTAWTATPEVNERGREQVRQLFGALGREMYVETENQIDMATALSATGPTYIFMVMEALTDAGVHLGFSRHVAQELVQQTMLGAVQFAMESNKHPAELRNMVTSPGGTSAEAIYQMEKGSLRTVLSKAVYAAYQRAVELGDKK